MVRRFFVFSAVWIVCAGHVVAQINRHAPLFTPAIDGDITAAEMAGQLEFTMTWPVPGGSLLLEGSGFDAQELSAIWYVSWDNDNLNVSAVVLDDTPDFRISSGGAGNVPYNAQDLIQPVFNPFNDPDHLFVDGQPADAFHGDDIAAIYDMVVNTSDDFGPDIYRHGPALSDDEHASVTIEGQETEFGYILEAAIPWATAMDDAAPNYVPTINDVHGLSFILVGFNGEAGATADIATLYTDFGNGANTIGDPTTWNSVTLVDAFVQPVTCDFDGDGNCDVADIDLLGKEIIAGTNNPDFDLTGNEIVDLADQDRWRADAAAKNGFAEPYLNGDANLDGSVLVGDLNAVGTNWQSSPDPWSSGDFNADGIVDVADLNGLALNWQDSIPAAAAQTAVPEPASLLAMGLVCGAMSSCLVRRRRTCMTLNRSRKGTIG